MRTINILFIEDNFLHVKIIGKLLENTSQELKVASTLSEGIDLLSKNSYDIILLDLNLPDSIEEETFQKIMDCNPDIPVILVTETENEDLALKLISEGAQDYLAKNQLNALVLTRSISRSIERYDLLKRVRNQNLQIDQIERDRLNINEALLQSKANFYRFVSESPLGIRIVTSEGETIYANKALLDIYGYSDITEFKNTPVKERYTQESLEAFRQRREARVNGRESGPTEYRISILRKSGEVRHLHVYRKEILWDDKMQYQVLYEDITDQIEAEKEIQQKNSQLQNSIAEKDKFLSIIAHDLKGPLGTFVAATQLIAEEIDEMSPSEVKEVIESIHTSSVNVYNLLENLLQWYRFKKNGSNFNPKSIHLKKYFESSIETCVRQAKDKGITISGSIPESLEVFADPHMFDTIIRNLVSNAVKFTPRGGIVSVTANEINDHLVQIEISDTGIGIPEKLKENLFQMNTNVHRKGTEGESGTGLGLLLCREFVEKHGGKIKVESTEGDGATFRITFPTETTNVD